MKFLHIIASIIFFHLMSFWLIAENKSYSSFFLQESNKQTKIFYDLDLFSLKENSSPQVIQYISFTTKKSTQKKNQHFAILFTYKNIHIRSAMFIGSHDKYQPHKMKRSKYGVWYYLMKTNYYKYKKSKNDSFYYQFIVKNMYIHDPSNPNYILNENNQLVSYLNTSKKIKNYEEGVFIRKQRNNPNKSIMFRIYAPKAKTVQLIGNFNQWSKKFDTLTSTEDGYFEIQKQLLSGEYYYLFIIDDKKEIHHSSGHYKHHPIFGLVSVVEVP